MRIIYGILMYRIIFPFPWFMISLEIDVRTKINREIQVRLFFWSENSITALDVLLGFKYMCAEKSGRQHYTNVLNHIHRINLSSLD